MQTHLREIYTQHLLNAVIEEKKELAIKMIEHGASIFSEKSDAVDAIYLCLDLNHLDMLNTILTTYHKKHEWGENGTTPEYLFQHYFQCIFKKDNVQALSIFDKHGLIDFAINFDPNPDRHYQQRKVEALSFSDMFKVGATKSILYCYDKLGEDKWIESLRYKIQYDLSVSSYDTVLLPKKEHFEFVQTMKHLNSDGFDLALLSALVSIEKTHYLVRNDHSEKNPNFLHIITDYLEVGLNPNMELLEMEIPQKFKDKENLFPNLKDIFSKINYKQGLILKQRPHDCFFSMIAYEETQMAIEKYIMEKATHSSSSQDAGNKKILKI